MLFHRLKLHQIDDVNDSNLEVRNVLPKQMHGRQRLQGRAIAAAYHHDLRLRSLIIARPFPDSDPYGAVLDRSVPIEVLKRRLLPGHDDIDVVPAAQTMVGYGK